jgi:SAM-dependent methyltransferase
MQPEIRLSGTVQGLLRCPVCHAKVKNVRQELVCSYPECGTHFPIIDGIPILLNEESSVFTFDDFVSRSSTFFLRESKLKDTLIRLMPSISANIKAKENYRQFRDLVLRQSVVPRVLVIGGSILGDGVEFIAREVSIDLVESDVSFGKRTQIICDAHDIPFEDGSFDGVIVQAVLEHVVDPYRCVAEIYRVLTDGGLVYSETPFMQQVHGRQFDFTRFTFLGHRRLFRRFEEIASGAACGPGMALAWAYQYFLLSFTTSRVSRGLMRYFSSFTAFYLKYFDYYLIDKPSALDAASGCYFMGKKARSVLSDQELVKLYKGGG